MYIIQIARKRERLDIFRVYMLSSLIDSTISCVGTRKRME